jgi:hypothetical protein
VTLRAVETRVRLFFTALQVRVDEFDKAVQILRGDGLVLLVEIVHVAIEDFHEKFNGNTRVHAGIGHAEGTLQALKNSFAVSVEL